MTRPHPGDQNAAEPPPRDDQSVDGDPIGEPDVHERLAANERALVETREALRSALADQDNVRKLAARERDEAVRFAAAQLAGDLLESVDNLRRAVESSPQGGVESLLSGVVATERNLLAALAKHGIRKIEPLGERFDPRYHEAVYQRAEPGLDTGQVMEVILPGYMIHDRLLRPAKVGVVDNEGIGIGAD
ncbi:nucleotide exchange factor GrpE [Devosia sp. ZB163]|uniref:nucleotide exchange factor GrpE n=1 Tax=Devosia sp. ZB163 TaxID=3025938 RepID=UPI002362803B|nr:nucleotide exchange factor GrpE [Devosia sp. ZB163]MDC9822664.1 nucleotide exchange factor GrpE [Devosia sp. ZB163]